VHRRLQETWQPLEVVASGELRNDATKLLVQVDLGVDDVGQDLPSAFDDRDRGLVAARLYP